MQTNLFKHTSFRFFLILFLHTARKLALYVLLNILNIVHIQVREYLQHTIYINFHFTLVQTVLKSCCINTLLDFHKLFAK